MDKSKFDAITRMSLRWFKVYNDEQRPLMIGFQSSTELLMNTMPLRDTVAGDALSILCTSKIILQFGAIGIRSPLAKVKVLLSSRTELRFSIQIASTGPSSNSQMWSPCNETGHQWQDYVGHQHCSLSRSNLFHRHNQDLRALTTYKNEICIKT